MGVLLLSDNVLDEHDPIVHATRTISQELSSSGIKVYLPVAHAHTDNHQTWPKKYQRIKEEFSYCKLIGYNPKLGHNKIWQPSWIGENFVTYYLHSGFKEHAEISTVLFFYPRTADSALAIQELHLMSGRTNTKFICLCTDIANSELNESHFSEVLAISDAVYSLGEGVWNVIEKVADSEDKDNKPKHKALLLNPSSAYYTSHSSLQSNAESDFCIISFLSSDVDEDDPPFHYKRFAKDFVDKIVKKFRNFRNIQWYIYGATSEWLGEALPDYRNVMNYVKPEPRCERPIDVIRAMDKASLCLFLDTSLAVNPLALIAIKRAIPCLIWNDSGLGKTLASTANFPSDVIVDESAHTDGIITVINKKIVKPEIAQKVAQDAKVALDRTSGFTISQQTLIREIKRCDVDYNTDSKVLVMKKSMSSHDVVNISVPEVKVVSMSASAIDISATQQLQKTHKTLEEECININREKVQRAAVRPASIAVVGGLHSDDWEQNLDEWKRKRLSLSTDESQMLEVTSGKLEEKHSSAPSTPVSATDNKIIGAENLLYMDRNTLKIVSCRSSDSKIQQIATEDDQTETQKYRVTQLPKNLDKCFADLSIGSIVSACSPVGPDENSVYKRIVHQNKRGLFPKQFLESVAEDTLEPLPLAKLRPKTRSRQEHGRRMSAPPSDLQLPSSGNIKLSMSKHRRSLHSRSLQDIRRESDKTRTERIIHIDGVDGPIKIKPRSRQGAMRSISHSDDDPYASRSVGVARLRKSSSEAAVHQLNVNEEKPKLQSPENKKDRYYLPTDEDGVADFQSSRGEASLIDKDDVLHLIRSCTRLIERTADNSSMNSSPGLPSSSCPRVNVNVNIYLSPPVDL